VRAGVPAWGWRRKRDRRGDPRRGHGRVRRTGGQVVSTGSGPGSAGTESKPAGSGGAGSPSDALTAFADATLTDAKAADRGEPDGHVSDAFGLGWQMSEIYSPDAPAQPPELPAGDLPDLSQLGAGDWEEIGLFQIQAGITKLSRAIAVAGLEVPDA